ncbi:uncharacterized protein [Physcomitrium patens]|uniref:uncharacterized protein isoform X3 n=1 Tax=Physcomitrium patens TaxID=3218 RepID=UPI003CCDC469
MQNKVNIAGMKDGIAALKRGKAFMNLIHKAKHLPEEKVPTGTLSNAQLNLRLSFHHGVFGTASILAFDPIQRLLEVASVDGRIKIFGGAGVEAFFQSSTRVPCKFLKPLMPNFVSGCILYSSHLVDNSFILMLRMTLRFGILKSKRWGARSDGRAKSQHLLRFLALSSC